MSKVDTKRVIITKSTGVGGFGNIKAKLRQKNRFCWGLDLYLLEYSEEKEPDTEIEPYQERTPKLIPFNPEVGQDEVQKMQKAIDEAMEKQGWTMDEALEEIEKKQDQSLLDKALFKEAEIVKARAIEHEVGFEVERIIDVENKTREVKVMKPVTKVTEKKLETIDFYFRPTGGLIYKTMLNFAKSKIK